MNDERPDVGFSIESLGEDSAELARYQLSLLEKSLGSARDPAGSSALFDEAYRAAHSLKTAIDSTRMPNVDRLARRIQDVVRATRTGALAITPELGSMLASVARIARDALDVVSAGGVEPLSASSAAAAMEEMLAHPGAWTVPAALSGVAVQWARVETVRLVAAGEAAGEARAASAAFAAAAEESAGFTERLRSAFSAHGEAVQALRDALPAGLVRAARGEPTSTIAAELAELASALSAGTSGLEQALSRNAAAVREAALHGARAAEKAEAAFGSFRSVRLDALLEDLPRLVRRGARDSGRDVDLVQESTNLEVDAARAESVSAVVKGCVRALLGTSGARSRKPRRSASLPAARLSLFARAAADHIYLRIALSSGAPDPQRLKAALVALQRRLLREGGSLEAESRKGGSASVLATIRSAAALTTRTVEFLLARAGDAWYALPASSVVECIQAGMATPEYVLDGSRLPTLRMNDTRDPREGVVVRTPRGGAVLLFDAIGGREYALQTLGGDSIAGIMGSVRRPDGSSARLVDLGVLLPAKH
jgi:chemotaxis protein histidine kinase CheA